MHIKTIFWDSQGYKQASDNTITKKKYFAVILLMYSFQLLHVSRNVVFFQYFNI